MAQPFGHVRHRAQHVLLILHLRVETLQLGHRHRRRVDRGPGSEFLGRDLLAAHSIKAGVTIKGAWGRLLTRRSGKDDAMPYAVAASAASGTRVRVATARISPGQRRHAATIAVRATADRVARYNPNASRTGAPTSHRICAW